MAEPTARDAHALVTYLIQELERRLAGRDQPILWRTAPGDVCHLGVLVPGGDASSRDGSGAPGSLDAPPVAEAAAPVAKSDAEGEDDADSDPDAAPAADDVPLFTRRAATRRDPTTRGRTSLGLQLLVQPDADGRVVLRIRPRFALYTRHFAPWEVQRREIGDPAAQTDAPPRRVRLIDESVRRAVRPAGVVITLDRATLPARLSDGGQVQAALDATLAGAADEPTRPLWRPSRRIGTISAADLDSPDLHLAFLARLTARPPSLLLRADLDVRPRLTPSGAVLIHIFLRNTTPNDPYGDPFNLLVDSALEVTIRQGTLVPIELVPIPDDYQIDRAVWALGHGCSAVVVSNRRTVRTVALARVSQPRMGSRADPPARLADLAADPLPVLADLAAAMRAYHTTWAAEVAAWVAAGVGARDPESWAQERVARVRDRDAFAAEVARFAEGIAALAASPPLMTAFQAMHRVMIRAANGRYDRWRLFQVVFLVSQLPALAARPPLADSASGPPAESVTRPPLADSASGPPAESAVLDRADVLWFPTGGGKTEAYLSLIACAILYDRLRGKTGGVTAWLRFPLRMLSVQQVQRASTVIWETEQERLALAATTGRLLGDPIALGYLVGKELTPNTLRVGAAPWPLELIASDPTLREKVHLIRHCPACRALGSVAVDVDVSLARIILRCTACGVVLPVYVSDSEVLRFLPALVIGTVDKVASIAYRATLAMLWAGPVWRCSEPGHGYGAGRWCGVPDCPTNPQGKRKPRKRSAVALADPAPALIIQDELHLIEQELGAFAGHYETLVRAEATHHSGAPPKVLAATATIAGFHHQARQLYGVRDAIRFPGRDRRLGETCYSTTVCDAEGRPQAARILLGFQPAHLTSVDAAILCGTLLHAIIADLHRNPYAAIAAASLHDAHTADAVQDLLHAYDTSVTYVGTKHSGTRISEALDHLASGRGGSEAALAVRLLTSDTPFGEIAATIDDLEQAPPWADPAHLDALVATSVISHGVDIARLNLMILDSMPGSMAEYIQASSRVGRRHLGLVIAVLPPQSLRATSLYHRWREIHAHLDQLITPVAINRFARSTLARTFAGVMLGALYSRALRQAGMADLDTVYALTGPLADATDVAAVTALAAQVYGLGTGRYPANLEQQARQQIAEQAALFVAALARLRATHLRYLREAFSPAPMASLRDVDISLPFEVSPTANERDLRWFRRASRDEEEA
ncbi:hypothetical protein EKD04_024745 [Chloroflexales bacterium ZM16-3]|nr:hypothetical protein [Chloroflexales bacterium ZM16-3]